MARSSPDSFGFQNHRESRSWRIKRTIAGQIRLRELGAALKRDRVANEEEQRSLHEIPLPRNDIMESELTYVQRGDDTVRDIVWGLILLERDATATYVRILRRLVDVKSREAIGQFLDNRQRRLAELTRMSFALRSGGPGEAVARHYLPTGRVALDSLMTDGAILNAMRVGEDETVAAYQRASTHPLISLKSHAMFERSLRDAIQHRSWTETAARARQAA